MQLSGKIAGSAVCYSSGAGLVLFPFCFKFVWFLFWKTVISGLTNNVKIGLILVVFLPSLICPGIAGFIQM